jgi:hypothetical protein
MNAGPVDHGQPGVPLARLVENFHQGNKVFATMVGDDGNPIPDWYRWRNEMYEDPVGHRHHPHRPPKVAGINNDVPLYSVIVDATGQEHHVSYLESRQFYCHFLWTAIKDTDAYKMLRETGEQGYNFEIVDPDGQGWPARSLAGARQQVIEAYLDPSVPFGHGKVLAAALLMEPVWYDTDVLKQTVPVGIKRQLLWYPEGSAVPSIHTW